MAAMTRNIKDSVSISATAETVFKALITPSAIQDWWEANQVIIMPETDGFLAISWGSDKDNPDYLTKTLITRFEPARALSLHYQSYQSKFGDLPFEAKLDAHFTMAQQGEFTILEVLQTGIPDDQVADDYYNGCITGWRTVLNNIKAYCET